MPLSFDHCVNLRRLSAATEVNYLEELRLRIAKIQLDLIDSGLKTS
jgi:hypothetical protein